MSDSITTASPAAPAPASTPAPATAPDGGQSSPPAASQQGISVSEAARLLNQQRRGQQPPGAQQPRSTPPATAQQPAAAPQSPAEPRSDPAAPPPASAVDSIAKALGLPETPGATPESTPAEPALEVDGRRITQAEIRRALAHQQDYTQKTQALAAERRQLQQQQEALATVLPLLQSDFARLQAQIAEVPQPDVRLLDTDRDAYYRQRDQWERAQAEHGRLGQLQALQQQAAERAMAEQVAKSNDALAKDFPQWADPATRSEWQQSIAEWAMEKGGFQRQELRQLADHRHLRLMMKAMMFDNMVSGAKTSAPMQMPPARGAPPPPAPTERIASAQQAFEAKPNYRNAAALLGARRLNGASH